MFGECHAHLFMNGRNYREAVRLHQPQVCETHIRAVFQAYQDKGIQFVRDGGDFLHVSEKAKEIAPEYGIDYRTPLYAIHKKGRYGGIVGLAYETMQEYRRLVEDVLQKNGDFIKIMVSGIMDFANGGALSEAPLPEAEIREMISIAHAYGLAVMVHANGAEAVRNAALAGADSIEHGNEADGDSLDAMAAMGTVWVPTLATVCNLKGCGRYPEETLQKLEDRAAGNLCAAWEKGVRLALGSDAGAYRVPHGQGLLDEYEIFQRLLGAGEALDRRLAEGEALIAYRFSGQEKHPAARETVVQLSHKKPDSVINVKVEFGEGDGKVPLDNIAKRAAAYKPKERVTYKMIKEYIEAKYGFKVHTAYIAEVKRDLGLPMYGAPNAVEELKQTRKHPTREKVKAIKDALKYFEVI